MFQNLLVRNSLNAIDWAHKTAESKGPLAAKPNNLILGPTWPKRRDSQEFSRGFHTRAVVYVPSWVCASTCDSNSNRGDVIISKVMGGELRKQI